MRVLTIGFTKKSARRFFELLRDSGTRRVIDVRLNNSSQLAGFAKKADLAWFLGELGAIDYFHRPDLAPTRELLRDWRTGAIDWPAYETRFLDLMRERGIERTLPKAALSDACLLCSEDQPHHCHRRLVAEYLNDHWGGVRIEHLGLAKAAPEP